MSSAVKATLVASMVLAANGFEATSANWEEKVMKQVDSGKMAFVKFLAPW